METESQDGKVSSSRAIGRYGLPKKTCSSCDFGMDILSWNVPIFWCSRCGTTQIRHIASTPAIVSRAIEFAGKLNEDKHADVIEMFENTLADCVRGDVR